MFLLNAAILLRGGNGEDEEEGPAKKRQRTKPRLTGSFARIPEDVLHETMVKMMTGQEAAKLGAADKSSRSVYDGIEEKEGLLDYLTWSDITIDTRNTTSLALGGSLLVSGGEDNTVKVWNSETGELWRTLDEGLSDEDIEESDGQLGGGQSVAMDWPRVVSGGWFGGIVKVWNLETGAVQTLEDEDPKWVIQGIHDVAIQGSRVVIAASEDVKVWNLETGAVHTLLQIREGKVAMDGSRVVVGSWRDAIVTVWNIESDDPSKWTEMYSRRKGGFLVLSVAMDGSRVVSGSWDKTVKVWNVETGELLHTLKGHSGWVESVAIHGSRVVGGSDSGDVKVWNVETGKLLHTSDVGRKKSLHTLQSNPELSCVAIDGTRVVSAGVDKIIIHSDLEGALHRPAWYYKQGMALSRK